MEAWVDRQVQPRDRSRAKPESRNYTFETGALLCVALMAATSWAVLAAGWVNGGGGAAVVAVTSVIEAALLAQARAPRIAAAIATPLLGLAAIVPTTLAAMPPVAGQTGGLIVGNYLRALFTGLASTQDWDFTVGLCAILYLCGYWLGWVALRERRGVLAVIPVFSVLATNVVNVKDPGPIGLPTTVAVVLALGVIAAAYLGALGDRWTAARITPIGGMRVRFGASAAAVAIGLTILALVIPAATSTDISARFFSKGLGLGSKGNGAPGSGGNGVATVGFNASVLLGGSLVSQPKQVIRYTTDTTATVYLGVAVDTYFDRGQWYEPARDANSTAPLSWSGVEYQGGPLPRDTNPADGGIGQDERAVKATIVIDPGATGPEQLVPFTGEPDAVNLPGVAYGTVAAPNSENAGSLLTVDSVELEHDIVAATTVKTTALMSTASVAQLRAAGIQYPAFTKQYTQLGDDASKGVETIHQLAQEWTAGQTTPYDQAAAIEQHLRNPQFFQYTLSPPKVPDKTTWWLVYFLTQSHRGYCQYFASAMGSMLRSLGIPARLVSGYGPGTTRDVNGPQIREGSTEQIVTTSDAHVWVEAYFPGYGWIPFEPTPPSSLGNFQPFPRGTAAGAPGVGQPQTTPRPGPTTKPGNVGGPDPGVAGVQPGHTGLPAAAGIALASLGVAAVLAAVALLWLALPRSLEGAWRRVEALGVISGLDRRKSETHRAFAARLAEARPRAGPALAELAKVTAEAEFSARPPSVRDRAQALRTWRRALFAATPRPGRSPG